MVLTTSYYIQQATPTNSANLPMAEWTKQQWPSIKEGPKLELAFIHSYVANTWRSIHHSRHIKRPPATFDSPATPPGVDWALCSLTGHSFSQGIAALNTRPAQHSMPSSADSTPRRSTGRTFTLGPTSLIHQDWHMTMAYLPVLYDWRRLNKYDIC